jgi:hypothetical protein
MYTLLTQSITVWRSVVQDLLLLSPSLYISHVMHTSSVRELRHMALGYDHIHARFGLPHGSYSINRLSATPAIDEIIKSRVISGLPYLILSTHNTSVHLVSLATGAVVSHWNFPGEIYSWDGDITLSASPGHSLGIAITVTWGDFHEPT